jgi:transposase-like protein
MARRGVRRDRSKERFWQRLLRLWRRSGRTVRDFCDEHGVSEPSFFAWRRMLAERDQQRGQRGRRDKPNARASADPPAQADDQPVFVPLRVVSTAAFEVMLKGGRVVRVPAGFDAASLRQLLAIVDEERPC